MAEVLKGPGRVNITYRDDDIEVRIGISPAKTQDGSKAYDVFVGDAKLDSKGEPVSAVAREKIRRFLKSVLSPLDGKLIVH